MTVQRKARRRDPAHEMADVSRVRSNKGTGDDVGRSTQGIEARDEDRRSWSWPVLGLGCVTVTWALATTWPAEAQAAAAAGVGVAVVAVTWRYANLTDAMRKEMAEQNHVAHEQLDEMRYLRDQERHGVLASFLAQLDRWHSFTGNGEPPHMPMSLDLYSAAARHLWRLWDEVRTDFVDIEARIQALNEQHEARARDNANRMQHLAELLHPTLDRLRANLRAYLFEYVVGCGKPGAEHCWRVSYDEAFGHDQTSLQMLFAGLGCPACCEPLVVQNLGHSAGWRDGDGEYHPRSDLPLWGPGTVLPALPGPAMH